MALRKAVCVSAIIFAALILAPQSSAQVTLNREDAFNFPSRHAWNLFLLLNHPAKDPKLGLRGAPDLSKKIGDPGVVVWETWRAATPEVYTFDGSRPPDDYNDMRLANSCPFGKVPEPANKAALVARFAPSRGGVHPSFNPSDGVGIAGNGGFGETHLNQSTYDTILKNDLYNLEGLKAYAAALVTGKRLPVSFGVDSIEVKAAWIQFTPSDIAAGLPNKYYKVDWSGRQFGLQTLHISTKDLPNWFWATFHHKDEAGHAFTGGREKPDTYGQPPQLKSTVWENYVLGGTQQTFTDSIGRPDYLSDAYIEQDFKTSSCITCHARASRSASGGFLSQSNPAVGTPDPTKAPAKFLDDKGNYAFAPIDFVWSTARAQPTDPNAKNNDPCQPQ